MSMAATLRHEPSRVVSSGPADSRVTPDGAFFYQIYGNAAKLIGYATQPDGSLTEMTRVETPYNSPIGMAGFWPLRSK